MPTQQYGVLRGQVKAVGRTAQTRQQIAAFLGDSQLGEQFSEQGQPVAVLVRLDRSSAHQVRLRLVLGRRAAVRARLHDPGRRRRPPGRAASRRLAAAVTAQQDSTARSTALPPPDGGSTAPERGRRRRAARGRAAAQAPKRRYKTVRTPTVLQMEAVECGAASLAMVLGHYGRHVPLEELRIACGVSRDGSRASNLLKAARSYGLTAKGMQMEPAALAEVPAPAILFWEFNHYVVYDGMGRRFGRRGVHINDPDKGRRFVPHGGLRHQLHRRRPDLRARRGLHAGAARKPGVLGAMPARLRGTAGTMLAALLASLLLVAVGAAVPALSRTYIDMFLIGGQTSLLGVLFASMGAMVLLTAVLTGAAAGATCCAAGIISSTLSSARFLRHLLRLPVTFFAQRSPADLVQRLQSNDTVAETLARDLAAAGVDAVVVILYAVLLWTLRPPTDPHRRGDRAAERGGDAGRDPAARHRYAEAARRHAPG